MATYSTNLALTLLTTGEGAGTWGNTTNTNLGTLLEQAISGYVTQAVSTGTDTTLTIPNGATGVARNMYIELTGTGGASTNLVVPANKKLYFIFNNTSSGQVTVKVSGQTGVSVPNGKKMVLVSNGTDVVNGLNYIADFGTNSFTVTNLTATSANITTLTGTTFGTTATTQLRGASGQITTLTSTSANITTLTGTTATYTSATVTNLALTSLTLANLNISSANVTTLTGTTATYGSATLTNLGSTSANITTLTGTNFSATSLTLTNALRVAEGGTGVDSTPTNGQLLIGNGSGFALSTLTAGTGMTITNNAGSITLASAGLPVVTVTSSTAISASAGFHYILTAGSAATVTLPASPTISDTIYVTVANSLTTNVIARNGKNIQGIAEDMTLNAPYASAQLRFTDNTEGWILA
jgi:hypothetical protein